MNNYLEEVLCEDVPCRFGCRGATGIYYMPGGCVCWPDEVQALCEQHVVKATPMTTITLIARPFGVRHKTESPDLWVGL